MKPVADLEASRDSQSAYATAHFSNRFSIYARMRHGGRFRKLRADGSSGRDPRKCHDRTLEPIGVNERLLEAVSERPLDVAGTVAKNRLG